MLKEVRPGHIIAVQLPPSPLFFSLLQASIDLGAVFCPLSLRLPTPPLALLRPKLFFSSATPQIFDTPPTTLPPSSFLLFTSGSTSEPKIVSLTHENFLASARSAIPLCDLQPNDTWLFSLPTHHVGGLSIYFRCQLASARFTTDPSNRSITHLSYVPTHLYRSSPIYPRLKTILLGGAPITHIPPKLPIIASYGMTETASLILGTRSPHIHNGRCHLGFPLPGKQIKLSPENEILLQGDSLFQGYYNGQTLVPRESWFATKDLATLHPTHGYAIIGRKDNQFISGGENIQPEEIEREILTHPSILEALVVPKSDPEYGMRPVAFIHPHLDIHSYLLSRLPKFKIPIAFHPLEVLRTDNLKISRQQAIAYANK